MIISTVVSSHYYKQKKLIYDIFMSSYDSVVDHQVGVFRLVVSFCYYLQKEHFDVFSSVKEILIQYFKVTHKTLTEQKEANEY